MLNVVANRLAIGAVVHHDIVLYLDRPARRQRTNLDIETVGRLIVARFHGAKPSSGKAF
jgi:hypothetical protein